jgi:hypothetical protein
VSDESLVLACPGALNAMAATPIGIQAPARVMMF